MLTRPLLALALAMSVVGPTGGEALAAPATSGGAASRRLAILEQALRSGDVDSVGRSVDALIALGHGDAAEVLARFVHVGQPDALLDRALERMNEAPFPAALPLLGELVRHRRAHVRRLAHGALAKLEPSARRARKGAADRVAVNAMLAEGLRDSDAGVRGRCARALGERHAVEQLEVLFHALERGVPEAGGAIGRIGDAEAVSRFHGQLGARPIGVMLDGYQRFLERDDIGEAIKLDIIAQLGEVASPTVKIFLERVLATGDWPPKSRVAFALRETAKRIDGQRVGQRVGKGVGKGVGQRVGKQVDERGRNLEAPSGRAPATQGKPAETRP